jgi:putative acetyltransferase
MRVPTTMLEIIDGHTDQRLQEAQQLFREYAASLKINLEFQCFDKELATLPGRYRPPTGRLLLACWDGQPAGCVALRRFSGGICEMKRLYVRPTHRGHAIGKRLALAVIHEAKTIGYHCMRLDTLSTMSAARALYQTLGFTRIEPYYDNPVEGAMFFELKF